MRGSIGIVIRVIKGDTTRLDYSSNSAGIAQSCIMLRLTGPCTKRQALEVPLRLRSKFEKVQDETTTLDAYVMGYPTDPTSGGNLGKVV